MGEFFLTFDVDWAPDFAIDAVASMLRERQLASTWFVTHRSPAVERLSKQPELFELGIHPNFLPNSTHGSDPTEVLDHVLEIVPNAISLRPHSVVQSGRLLELIITRTRIRLESACFLPGMPGIRPTYFTQFGGSLLRVPFFWADDYEMGQEAPDWDPTRFFTVAGVKVFDFHPLHVYMNSSSKDGYVDIKRAVPHLSDLSTSQADAYKFVGEGVQTLFTRMLDHITDTTGSSRRLCDLEHSCRTRIESFEPAEQMQKLS